MADAVAYRTRLQAVAPEIEFMMTLYLNSALTPEDIRAAAAAGVVGVKSYPKGVTTNSESGIESYDLYDAVFAAMEQEGLVLNLHGEVPSDHSKVSRAEKVLDAGEAGGGPSNSAERVRRCVSG